MISHWSIYARLLQHVIDRMHSPEPRTPTNTSEDLTSYKPTLQNPQNLAICIVTLYQSRPRSRPASRSAADAATDGRRVSNTLRPSSYYPWQADTTGIC